MGNRGSHDDGVGPQVHRTASLVRGVDAPLSDDGTPTIKPVDKSLNNLIIGTVGLRALPGIATQCRPDEISPCFSGEQTVVNLSLIHI